MYLRIVISLLAILITSCSVYQIAPLKDELFIKAIDSNEQKNVDVVFNRAQKKNININKELDLVDKAIHNFNIPLAKYLLERGFQPKHLDLLPYYLSIDELYELIKPASILHENLHNVNSILDAFYNKDDFHYFENILSLYQNIDGLGSLLEKAVIEGKEDYAILILENKLIDIEIDSLNLLSYAVLYKQKKLTDYLLGVNDKEYSNNLLNPKYSLPPLYAAILSFETALLKEFISHIDNLDIQKYENMSPLDIAENILNDEAVEILLQNLKRPDHKTTKSVQQILTNLGYKIKKINGIWDDNSFQELLKYQLDKNLPSTGYPSLNTLRSLNESLNIRALFIASKNDDKKTIQKIINSKIIEDFNLTDSYGWTPLIHASQNSSLKAAELLLKNGADVNKRELYSPRMTPLMMSAIIGNKNMIDILINYEAKVEEIDDNKYRAGDLYIQKDESIRRTLASPDLRPKKWLVIYDKFKFIKGQKYIIEKDGRKAGDFIKNGWSKDLAINKVEYIDGSYFITMNDYDYPAGAKKDQKYILEKNTEDLKESIKKLWEKKYILKSINYIGKGSILALMANSFFEYGITMHGVSAAYWIHEYSKSNLEFMVSESKKDGKSILSLDIGEKRIFLTTVNAKKIGLQDQKLLITNNFPRKEIINLSKFGYKITDIDYSKAREKSKSEWIILLTQGTESTNQLINYYPEFPYDEIKKLKSESYIISNIIFTG
jgi:ankyrin repeat protein